MKTTEQSQRKRAAELLTEVGADLAHALEGAEMVTGPSLESTVAAWPWPIYEAGKARPWHGSPGGWEHVASSDRTRICVTANLIHFSRPGTGLLYLDPEAPLWRLDLGLYPKIIGDLLGFSFDRDHQHFGLVTEDRTAGLLFSCRRHNADEPVHELSCWGL